MVFIPYGERMVRQMEWRVLYCLHTKVRSLVLGGLTEGSDHGCLRSSHNFSSLW